jgi:hypothetical protein
MKAFRFRLAQVLRWRETELQLEEAQVEKLRSMLRAAEEARDELPQRLESAHDKVCQAPVVHGSDLAQLERLRVWTLREEQRLVARIAELQRAIRERMPAVNQARQRVRLLERLREKRHESWKFEAEAEIEAAAAESAIAQWRRAAAESA